MSWELERSSAEAALLGMSKKLQRLLGGFQGATLRLQLADDVLKILERARQPVDAGDDQRVARAQKLQQDVELGAALAGAAPT